LTPEEKTKFDRFYVKNVSLLLDLRILWRTFFSVIMMKSVI